MLKRNYYHGTSFDRLKQIKSDGFKLRDGNWDKWLCAYGIYFVLNRPIVAYYYAKLAALIDAGKDINTDPVVISVPLNVLENHKILDLTTDTGMIEFYEKYSEIKEKYGSKKSFLSSKDKKIDKLKKSIIIDVSPEEKQSYIESIIASQRPYKQFKWDCAVITELVRQKGYSAVIAIFQEGLPLAYDFYNHKYQDDYVPSYQGLRYRDAIVVCITDLNAIDKDTSAYVDVKIDVSNYPPQFMEKGSSIKMDLF